MSCTQRRAISRTSKLPCEARMTMKGREKGAGGPAFVSVWWGRTCQHTASRPETVRKQGTHAEYRAIGASQLVHLSRRSPVGARIFGAPQAGPLKNLLITASSYKSSLDAAHPTSRGTSSFGQASTIFPAGIAHVRLKH